jgi:cell wall-associated NlpC family hydrolase
MLVAVVIVALSTSETWATKAHPAWVIPESLLVRSGPRGESKRIGTLNRGAKVYVTGFANKWCWCTLPGGGHGWVAEWMLQFSADKGRQLAGVSGAKPAAPRGTPPAWINVTAANVRSAPGLGGDPYGQLKQGDKIYVLARSGDWVKCRTPGGSGWLRSDLLEYDVGVGRKLAAANGKAATVAAKPASGGNGPGIAKAYVLQDKVFLRSGPGSHFDQRAALIKGQALYISAKRGQWRKVTVHGGASGWVAAWLIKQEDETVTAGKPANASAGEVARTEQVLSAWVSADKASIHDRPTTDSPVKFHLKQGAKMRVAAVSGHWCKMRTDSGNFGWVAAWKIKFVPPGHHIVVGVKGQRVEVNVGWVARPTVNLRTSPSTGAGSNVVATLGTRLIIIGKKDDWYRVALEDGSIGWMSAHLVDTRAQRLARRQTGSSNSELARAVYAEPQHDFPPPTTGGSSGNNSISPEGGTGQALVETARQFLHCSYVSGGCGPNAFDCSGLVRYVHAQHGIDISHDSREQFRQGSPVSRDSLQPGDVVFFKNTYRSGISHVGMYIGDGKFIHAANPHVGVKITDLSEDYYSRRYVGARRMY